MKYSTVTKQTVVTIDSGKGLGKIIDLVIDNDNGRCLALLIQLVGVMARKKIVLIDDVSSFGDDTVMVQSEKILVPLKDNEDIVKVVDRKVKIIGNEVVSYSGEELGEVKDFVVDETSYKLSKLFVSTGLFRDLFKGELIITANKIVSIGKDAIVVKDAVVEEEVKNKGKSQESELARAGVMNKDTE
ncbi:MAG: PRC-barrel domain-containing protein [Parcubacteria group bacterium]|nr:PRC-barrel domain-containing protein [Parcubacteria group bacterium]